MLIHSLQNAKLKDIRRLRRSKGDHAVLEGPHLLAEALASGLVPRSVLVTPEFQRGPEGAALCLRLARPPLEVEPKLLAELADADSPQGVVAVVELARGGVTALPVVADGLYLYLDRVQDPGNLGALARVAEAAGAAGLALSPGCVHPNHPRALRASAGSLLRLPVAREVGVAELASHLEALAARWCALVPRDGCDLYQEELGGALVLALGAEGEGLSHQLLAAAGTRLTIPLAPPVESLNVTTAAAIALFELRRRAPQPRAARTASTIAGTISCRSPTNP